MNFLSLIEAKREGRELTTAQIQEIIAEYVAEKIPDYQMSAFLMAIFFRGLSEWETRDLTLAMRDSGEKLSFTHDTTRPVVDKHSTGGVGDKVSLSLAPLLACLGFRVPMISGRGLGITGGTLDKLESIPGFCTQWGKERIHEIVEEVGCCMAGQTPKMVPADRKLYALRDVTATIESRPLLTSSILSKKLAEDLEALVLDVKWGRAAFMQKREDAQLLADMMAGLGNDCGVKTTAFLNEMNAPLGRCAGNWLEVVESVDCLEGKGPKDLEDLVLRCAAKLLLITEKETDEEAALRQAKSCLVSGRPRQKWNELLRAQGADLEAFEAKLQAISPCFSKPIIAKHSGVITDVNARIIGEIVRDLGGGRLQKEALINHDVGIANIKSIGEKVQNGDELCVAYCANKDDFIRIESKLNSAFSFA